MDLKTHLKLSLAAATLLAILATLTGLPAPTRADNTQTPTALLYNDMSGQRVDKIDQYWGWTRKVLSNYYNILPDDQVLPVHKKAMAAGCKSAECVHPVKEKLDVPIVIHLRHIDEGYFNQLYLTVLQDGEAVEKHYTCTYCTHREFQNILGRLARKFEE